MNNEARSEESVMKEGILNIQQEGRKAEVVIDTGHALRGGKNWLAYAKVYCPNIFTAQLVADRLAKRLGDAVQAAREEAYELGYEHASGNQPRISGFSRVL